MNGMIGNPEKPKSVSYCAASWPTGSFDAAGADAIGDHVVVLRNAIASARRARVCGDVVCATSPRFWSSPAETPDAAAVGKLTSWMSWPPATSEPSKSVIAYSPSSW